MPEIRRLRNAPIKEAIIDIQVKARLDFDVKEFIKLKSGMEKDFPVVEELRGGHVQVIFPRGSAQLKSPRVEDWGTQGYLFKNQNANIIAQFRVDGFSLNKLPPYTSWEELRPLAIDLWGKYRSIAKPEAVSRVALRYINHISINELDIDFDDYLRSGPKVPPELPQTITRFFNRTTIVDPENRNFVHVAQAYELQQPVSSSIIIILDIDAYKDISTPADDPTLFDYFLSLRELKNKVFFSYLTEKTIGLFE